MDTSGHMPADLDDNGLVTLHELFRHISRISDSAQFQVKGMGLMSQHVQVYPAESHFGLFRRAA